VLAAPALTLDELLAPLAPTLDVQLSLAYKRQVRL